MAEILSFQKPEWKDVQGRVDFPPAEGVRSRLEEGSRHKNLSLKIEEIETELNRVLDVDYVTYVSHCKFTHNPPEESEGDLVANLAGATELVLFSPEIQGLDCGSTRGMAEPAEFVQWGDVFVKIKDGYRFLFTLYTARYAARQLSVFGEKIHPSPQDVILRAERLIPSDILRATMKWTNLHAPDLRGKPIRLEEESNLRDLVCDPEVELVLSLS